MELFAGAGGLTAAVARLGRATCAPVEVARGVGAAGGESMDLRDDAVYKRLVRQVRTGKVRWLHGGPPCKTFSRARRTDRHGRVEALRSDRYPGGMPGCQTQLVMDGNLLARRMASLARAVQRAGGWWSIENPAKSYLWEFGPIRTLRKLPGVQFIIGDQCCFGGQYRKPTGWLGNAPFLPVLGRTCPGPPAHPAHPVLQGRAVTPDGRACWLTELAAEYPEGLCNQVAKAYDESFARAGDGSARAISMWTFGRNDPLEATKRQQREAQNNLCIGGLRDPADALLKVPGWGAVGARVRGALQGVVQRHSVAVAAVLASVGQPEAPGYGIEVLRAARVALAETLGIAVPPGGQGIWSEAVGALVQASGDPDIAVPRWLSTATPLGILHDIEACGIFPAVTPEEAAAAARGFADVDLQGVLSGNYTSYAENRDDADAELQRELHAGYVTAHHDRGVLESRHGPLELSRVGVLVKVKNNKKKVRLIHDLSRSGINQKVRLPERVVLPRLRDIIEFAGALLAQRTSAASVRCLVLDFKDAFKQLSVAPDEQRFLSGSWSKGWFVYQRLLFGIVCGPLLWGRVAACIMRATQALYPSHACRLACYVDDPFILAFGTDLEQQEIFAVSTLLWAALGFNLAWSKGHLGTEVDWIGAHVALDREAGRVVVSLPAEKRREALEGVQDLLRQGQRVRRKDLRQVTGRIEWIAGMLPQLRPFAQMLWAALASDGAGRQHIWAKQVAIPLKWFREFFSDSSAGLTRSVRVDPPNTVAVVAFDASPSGGGAVLWVVPATFQVNIASLMQVTPFAFMHASWSPTHCVAAGARRGQCADQARWETYCMVLAVHTWQKVIYATTGRPILIGDALGIMNAAVRFRSKDPTINIMLMELALVTAPIGADIEAIHIWSEVNEWADTLSRLDEQGVEIPEALTKVPRTACFAGPWRLLGRTATPPAGERQGCAPPSDAAGPYQ